MSEIVKMALYLDNSLEYADEGSGPLRVKKSLKSGNALSFESDGLYAEAIPGKPGSTGTGYPDNYRSANGVISGVATPESMNSVPKRIVGPNIIHRIFTASNPDGSGGSGGTMNTPGNAIGPVDVTENTSLNTVGFNSTVSRHKKYTGTNSWLRTNDGPVMTKNSNGQMVPYGSVAHYMILLAIGG